MRTVMAGTSRIAAVLFVAAGMLGTACDGGGSKSKGKVDASTDEDDGETGRDGGKDDDEAKGDAGAGSGGGGGGGGGSEGPQCQGDCSDKNDCTLDECVADGVCTHTLDPSSCEGGASCHPKDGCTKGKACATTADCADDDGCTVNERCGPELATCEFDPLDRDRDGFAPLVCGGGDCNDADPRVGPGQTERCNGEDDDCNGKVDDNAVCPGDGQVCKDAACVCSEGLTQCGRGGNCFDLDKDPRHCGECGNDCGPAGVCSAGKCECPAPGELCNGVCVNTETSSAHCGGCGNACSNNPPEACVAGECAECGGAGEACCTGPSACRRGFVCSGEPGAKGATCECESPRKVCGNTCVDTSSSESNCGECGQACEFGELCEASECKACGDVGEPCCEVAGIRFCGSIPGGGGGPGNNATCNQNTFICDPV